MAIGAYSVVGGGDVGAEYIDDANPYAITGGSTSNISGIDFGVSVDNDGQASGANLVQWSVTAPQFQNVAYPYQPDAPSGETPTTEYATPLFLASSGSLTTSNPSVNQAPAIPAPTSNEFAETADNQDYLGWWLNTGGAVTVQSTYPGVYYWTAGTDITAVSAELTCGSHLWSLAPPSSYNGNGGSEWVGSNYTTSSDNAAPNTIMLPNGGSIYDALDLSQAIPNQLYNEYEIAAAQGNYSSQSSLPACASYSASGVSSNGYLSWPYKGHSTGYNPPEAIDKYNPDMTADAISCLGAGFQTPTIGGGYNGGTNVTNLFNDGLGSNDDALQNITYGDNVYTQASYSASQSLRQALSCGSSTPSTVPNSSGEYVGPTGWNDECVTPLTAGAVDPADPSTGGRLTNYTSLLLVGTSGITGSDGISGFSYLNPNLSPIWLPAETRSSQNNTTIDFQAAGPIPGGTEQAAGSIPEDGTEVDVYPNSSDSGTPVYTCSYQNFDSNNDTCVFTPPLTTNATYSAAIVGTTPDNGSGIYSSTPNNPNGDTCINSLGETAQCVPSSNQYSGGTSNAWVQTWIGSPSGVSLICTGTAGLTATVYPTALDSPPHNQYVQVNYSGPSQGGAMTYDPSADDWAVPSVSSGEYVATAIYHGVSVVSGSVSAPCAPADQLPGPQQVSNNLVIGGSCSSGFTLNGSISINPGGDTLVNPATLVVSSGATQQITGVDENGVMVYTVSPPVALPGAGIYTAYLSYSYTDPASTPTQPGAASTPPQPGESSIFSGNTNAVESCNATSGGAPT